jgi:hypothetical protein
MTRSRFRLILGATAFVLVLAGLTLPAPVQSASCFRCHPDGGGFSSCQASTHGMTQCADDTGVCILSGSTC